MLTIKNEETFVLVEEINITDIWRTATDAIHAVQRLKFVTKDILTRDDLNKISQAYDLLKNVGDGIMKVGSIRDLQ